MMNNEENDPLWKLLGRAKSVEPSPFFARNVLREIRKEPRSAKGDVFHWLSLRWRAASVFATVVLAICLSVVLHGTPEQRQSGFSDSALRISENPDFEVIAELDVLLAAETDSLWLETSGTF